ncbi:MAG: beta-galactosidase [Formosimonas sp.]
MYLGVDYYPEHWPADMLAPDLARMAQMGVNMIRVGEFAWHLMEPTEGQFDFSYFDHVIQHAKKQGFKVMFGTPTATFPAWLAHQKPDILSQNAAGHTHAFGGRRQYCFNSADYLHYSLRIVEQLVSHYAHEKAIVVWQIDNELGHEGSDQCYCPQCHTAFQAFLVDKFAGDITALNETYGTIFWGQTYNHFAEIPMPTPTITTHNPALRLDWARFRSASINQFAKAHNDLIRQLKGAHQQVTTNLFGGFFNVAHDQNILADMLDFVSYDNYPVWGGLKQPLPAAQIAMTLDYIRGLKQQNFWIVEELMGAQGHNHIGYLPRPNQAKLWAYQAMARGCENLLFFRWRGMNRGAEQFCLGIVDAHNQTGRKFNEVKEFISDIVSYKSILQEPIHADVAIVYDYDNIKSWEIQQQSDAFDFTQELMRFYTPLHRCNVMTDVLSIHKDFSRYKILIVPAQQIIDDELAQRLEAYVHNGGILLAGYRCGIKNRDNNLHFKQVAPYGLTHVFGVQVLESESLSLGMSAEMTDFQSISTVHVWRDMLDTTESTEILWRYHDTHYADKACVTRHKYGAGWAYYVGAGLELPEMLTLTEIALAHANVHFIKSTANCEVIQRGSHASKVTFSLRHDTFEVNIER